VHMLLSLPTTISVAVAVQKIKANSSRWVRETFPESQGFQWQKGYGAFSVGISQVENTIEYIKRQEQHHRCMDYRQEFISFLKKHGIELQDEL